MKEAAGEANMTVVTIALIGVVLLIGGVVVRNVLKNTENTNPNSEQSCVAAGGTWSNGACTNLPQ